KTQPHSTLRLRLEFCVTDRDGCGFTPACSSHDLDREADNAGIGLRLDPALRTLSDLRLACHQSQTPRGDVKSLLRLVRRGMRPQPRRPQLGLIVGRKALIALVFLAAIRFHSADPKETIPARHAPLRLLSTDPARDPEGGGGCLPPADVAGRPHPPRGRRDLRVAA